MREAKTIELSSDSIGASSIGFQLAFEKWIGEADFVNLLQNTLSEVKQLLTSNTPENAEMTKYITDPYDFKLSKNVLYRWLTVLKMPSSR